MTVCLALTGCAGTSLLVGVQDPAAHRISTAEGLARFLQNRVLSHPFPPRALGDGMTEDPWVSSVECYPSNASRVAAWHCVADTNEPDPRGPGATVDVAYHQSTGEFLERDPRRVAPPFRFGRLAASRVLEQRPGQVSTSDGVQRVKCAHT